jgi:hypothetical protein
MLKKVNSDSAFFRNPHYHRSSDTTEILGYRVMAELLEILLIFLVRSLELFEI